MPSNVSIVVKDIGPTHRKNVNILADVVVEITVGEHVITVKDARVLQGKDGKSPWCAMPSFSVPNGREWSYHSTVVLSADLQKLVSDAVLTAYANWAKTNSGVMVNAHGLRVSDMDVDF